MSSNSADRARPWSWRRWIDPGQADVWIERVAEGDPLSWSVTEMPGRVRALLAVYFQTRAQATRVRHRWGGAVRRTPATSRLRARPSPPLRIGRALEIVRGRPTGPSPVPRLCLPHGLAFGSGEHATTSMLLHALARRRDLRETAVLDLGTGSGVLALAARRLGSYTIAATDFDAAAVRTARENESRNFPQPLVRWQCADVRRLRAREKYGLVVANLFSGILCEAAEKIAGAVSPGGELWLSGILRAQEGEVTAAYRRRKLRLVRAARRGKWVMLQWRKSPHRGEKRPLRPQLTVGPLRKIAQTK
jgi:ribosomal protein L11 methyltransferase